MEIFQIATQIIRIAVPNEGEDEVLYLAPADGVTKIEWLTAESRIEILIMAKAFANTLVIFTWHVWKFRKCTDL